MYAINAVQSSNPLVRGSVFVVAAYVQVFYSNDGSLTYHKQMTTQYCSQDCQKTHWASHKPICQHTTSSKQQVVDNGSVDENLVKGLRKFTSMHANLLGWAGFQALQLKRVPANVRQSALLVELSYRPSSSDPNRR